MSLKQYQAFLKAAELHSVSAAAEALGVTQTSLLAAAGKTTAKKKTESAAAATTNIAAA